MNDNDLNPRRVERLTNDLMDGGMGEFEASIRAKSFLRQIRED